jgi:hypothetical protein
MVEFEFSTLGYDEIEKRWSVQTHTGEVDEGANLSVLFSSDITEVSEFEANELINEMLDNG